MALLLPRDVADRATCISVAPSNVSFAMSTEESNAFDYFRKYTLHQLPGSSRVLSWELLTLPTSQYEPAVAHAMIALASMHRSLDSSQSHREGYTAALFDSTQHHLAVEQYTRALKCLQDFMRLETATSNSGMEVIILLSLLFFCFEIFQGEDAIAQAHFRTGTRLLLDRLNREQTPGYPKNGRQVVLRSRPLEKIELLAQTFVRLDSDLALVRESGFTLRPICLQSLPKCFVSVDEALVHLDALQFEGTDIMSSIQEFTRSQLNAAHDMQGFEESMVAALVHVKFRLMPLDSVPELQERMETFGRKLKAWNAAYASLRWKPEDELMHLLASIHSFFLWLEIIYWRSSSEMDFDKIYGEFEHTLSLAERYVELEQSLTQQTPGSGSHNRRVPTLGTNVPVIVYTIAEKCRSSRVRRRCTQLLRRMNLQGVSDQHYVASLLEHTVALEERQAKAITGKHAKLDLDPKDFPEEARLWIAEICADFGSGVDWNNFYKQHTARVFLGKYSDVDDEIAITEARFSIMRLESNADPRDDARVLLPELCGLDTSCVGVCHRFSNSKDISTCSEGTARKESHTEPDFLSRLHPWTSWSRLAQNPCD